MPMGYGKGGRALAQVWPSQRQDSQTRGAPSCALQSGQLSSPSCVRSWVSSCNHTHVFKY